ncbi:response regulator transcription factor [Cryptosporangium sp. NPDC048952]|uniref:response regulator transcription factor n=1 Tax=Cryptosporangium sp. NPDC048952 TaxID=3363961 RepID=UPI0037220B68
MGKLLIIEDDSDIALGLKLAFDRAGHHGALASDGPAGLRLLFETRPDLVVLDLGLPGLDGWQILGRIREISDVPVLILTAHCREADKLRALRSGADDYLTKPFSVAELLARVGVLLRRHPAVDWSAAVYNDSRLSLDTDTRTAYADGAPVTLSRLEFRLLQTLTRNRNVVLSPTQLLDRVWDDPTGIAPQRVKFAILRLRRRLGWADPTHSPIESVRGIGYRYRLTTPPTGPAAPQGDSGSPLLVA